MRGVARRPGVLRTGGVTHPKVLSSQCVASPFGRGPPRQASISPERGPSVERGVVAIKPGEGAGRASIRVAVGDSGRQKGRCHGRARGDSRAALDVNLVSGEDQGVVRGSARVGLEGLTEERTEGSPLGTRGPQSEAVAEGTGQRQRCWRRGLPPPVTGSGSAVTRGHSGDRRRLVFWRPKGVGATGTALRREKLAQLAEQRADNPWVGGSSPPLQRERPSRCWREKWLKSLHPSWVNREAT